MSVAYRPVGWTVSKIIYDAVLLFGIFLYLIVYIRLAPQGRPAGTLLDGSSQVIRAFGTCAFILLSLVLMIGPLARLNNRFLPLLYNRRHFGVITCVVASAHMMAVFEWYLAFSPLNPWVAVLMVDSGFGPLRGFPYIPFGAMAFTIMVILAATSHDFWLNFLTPPVWKALHMSIYAAYALVVAHVAFGALHDTRNLALPLVIGGFAVAVTSIHVLAGWTEWRRDVANAGKNMAEGWVDAGPLDRIADGRGLIVVLPNGESVAVFRNANHISAVSNLCAHQNGPLAEGRIRDGKVICPWHGYEYCLRSGRAPAPFTERIATYHVRLVDNVIFIHSAANPPGTEVEPARILAEGLN